MHQRIQPVLPPLIERSLGCHHDHHLYFWLHAIEARQHVQHGAWRGAGRTATDDRLGGSPRKLERRRLDVIRDPVFLAAAALFRDRLDVS